MTKCECTLAGFCGRHNVKKSTRMVELCQTDISYWTAWEENRGPGQLQPKEECLHKLDGQCEIVSEIALVPFAPSNELCNACTNCARPRRLNHFTMTVAYKLNPDLDISLLESVIDGTATNFGTKLANTIGLVFRSGSGCGCSGHQDILDVWTPKYIEDNLEKVVDWLQNEAKSRKIPFSRVLTRILLKRLL